MQRIRPIVRFVCLALFCPRVIRKSVPAQLRVPGNYPRGLTARLLDENPILSALLPGGAQAVGAFGKVQVGHGLFGQIEQHHDAAGGVWGDDVG